MLDKQLCYRHVLTTRHGYCFTTLTVCLGSLTPLADLIANRVNGAAAYHDTQLPLEVARCENMVSRGARATIDYWGGYAWIELEWQHGHDGSFCVPTVRLPTERHLLARTIPLFQRLDRSVQGKDRRQARWDDPANVLGALKRLQAVRLWDFRAGPHSLHRCTLAPGFTEPKPEWTLAGFTEG